MTIDISKNLINKFLDTISGLSANTVRNYKHTLWILYESCGGDLTEDKIREFLQRYQSSSLHRHKAAVKLYLEYLDPDKPWPFSHRQFTAARRKIPRYINPVRIPDLVGVAANEDEKMFVETLFQLGCRISELRGIAAEDVEHNGVKVLTKGGQYRLKPVTAEFAGHLQTYVRKKAGKNASTKIFPEKYQHYYALLKRLGAAVGIDHISPHMLRHARALDLYEKSGKDLNFVKEFLGHAGIGTTAIYLEISGGDLVDKLEAFEGNKAGGSGS